MNYIIAPTVDLFVYQKGEIEADGIDVADREVFLRNFPADMKVDFSKINGTSSTDYIKLTEGQQFRQVNDDANCQEYYYPVFLHDTYSLFYGCHFKDTASIREISCFASLKSYADSKHGNLGRIMMLSGVVPPNEQDLKTLAKNIYIQAKLENWHEPKCGKLIGADVFEWWQGNTHILIILFPTHEQHADLGKFTRPWLNLFCFRHKIIWAYQQTRQIKKDLKNAFDSLKKTLVKIENIYRAAPWQVLNEPQLEELEQILKFNIAKFYDYTSDLNRLEMYSEAIEINLENYQTSCTRLLEKAKAINSSETNLSILDEFSQLVEQKFCRQIKKDIASLSPGIRVLEGLVNTIQGLIEIDRAKSDRHLEKTIAILGTSIGAASLSGTAIANYIPNITNPQATAQLTAIQVRNHALLNTSLTMLFSLAIGIATGILVKVRFGRKK